LFIDRLFVKLPQSRDSELIFAVFESSYHPPVTTCLTTQRIPLSVLLKDTSELAGTAPSSHCDGAVPVPVRRVGPKWQGNFPEEPDFSVTPNRLKLAGLISALSLQCWTSSREAVNTNFLSLVIWFD